MTTYQEKLNQLNVNESALPKEIKENIQNLNVLISEMHAKGDEVEALTDPAEIASGNAELDEMEENIEAIDTAIAVDIDGWWANKQKYAARVQAMQEGRKAKQALKDAQQQPPAPAATAAPAAAKPATPAPAAAASAAPAAATVVVAAEEDNDWGWWVLGGLIAAVTLGTVILKKK